MKKSFLRLIFPLIIFTFSTISHAKLLDKVVAIVDDSPILESDISTLSRQLGKSQDLANLYGMRGKSINRQNVLDKLIEEKIIRVTLKNLNAEVSDGEVNSQIKSIADQNRLSVDGLKLSLEKDGIPFETYQRSIRTQLERRRIFDREVRKTAASISDLDLKNEFMKKAPREYELGMLVDKDTPANRKLFTEVAEKINSKSLSHAKVKEHPDYQELGWIDPQSINPAFRNAVQKTSEGKSTSLVVADGRVHILIIHQSRQGSDEQFESQKDRIRDQLMSSDYESRFKNWIDKKKDDLQVVINK